MKITKKVGCAVSILTVIGKRNDEIVPVKTIALESSFSEPFTRKVIHELEMLGYVKSVMGPKGGYVMAKDPSQINLDILLMDLEEKKEMVECVYNKSCTMHKGCMINLTMHRLNKDVRDVFRKYSIEDFIKGVENGKDNLPG
ncbi:MAG: Rrf2 family transcriptional regulator [bacterium]|nr:Rrf2 family transcriptional regulator [bacterium]